MDKVYWIKFYEDGKFVTAIGQPHRDRYGAIAAITAYLLQIQNIGFQVIKDGPDSFHYERYGTVCAVRIEEE